MTSAYDERINRLEAVRALHRALIDVRGIGIGEILDIVSPNQASSIYWQVAIKTRAYGMVHILESETEGVRILRREKGKQRVAYQADEPEPRSLVKVLCHQLIGRGTVPVQSRKQVRDVLGAARANAEYTFRVGMAHLLDHPELVANWADAEDPDRWETIEVAYQQALNIRPEHSGFLPSFRKAGVQMDIMDIYEEAHIDRAVSLLDTITPRKRP